VAETREEYEARALRTDENVPGLVTTTLKVVGEKRIGAWKFERLDDGGLFVSQWRGAADCEQMVSYELFDAAAVALIAGLLEG